MPQLLLIPTSLSASANTALIEALWLLERRLTARSSNQDAFNDLLQQVFGVSPGASFSALQTTISSSGLSISVQVLDANSIDGLNAAYTSAAPEGGERIYLSASWLELAAPEQIEAVLLEEIGHAINHRLNQGNDTTGDEGAIFSALLRGETTDPAEFRENDRRILTIDGVAVAVEASTDTTPPTGSLEVVSPPAYTQEGEKNPFGIPNVGWGNARPTLTDIDGDTDLDLFIGDGDGNTLFFRNTANLGNSAPAFTQEGGNNPFGITNNGLSANPAFADIDGDGDLDLFIGNYDGNTLFFRNTASPDSTTPAFTQEGGINPFGITTVTAAAIPAFADIDGDGDLDLFIGNQDGNTLFFRNTASPDSTTPAFTHEMGANGEANPFGITDVNQYASPAFADIDGDGDLDLFIGDSYGLTYFFQNTAAPGTTTPAYTWELDAYGEVNPFGIINVNYNASPAFADIDGDGDLDLFIGDIYGNTLFSRNTTPPPTAIAPVGSTTANGTYGIGDVINLTVSFNEVVLVNTTSGTPTLQLKTGSTDRYATYSSGSGSSTLSFQYMVQDGDNTSDLDQFSSTALTLNGGVIADAAGNPAILTLAEPGQTGSLRANADLVIEGVVPTDTTPPTGSLSFATAYTQEGGENPFGIPNVGYDARPTFADIDDDGDLDLFIGDVDGNTLFFRNTANLGNSTPAFTQEGGNRPFGIPGFRLSANPAFADIDGDGDLDLFIGNYDGDTFFFRNTGSAITASFTQEGDINPFGILGVAASSIPTFADIDGDGDLDLFIGNYYGNVFFFRNTADPGSTTPEFAQEGGGDPFQILQEATASPSLKDIDGDSDFDLFLGNGDGNTLFFRNTASPNSTTPAFTQEGGDNPFGITDVGYNASPALADIDGDGDLDLFIGNYLANTVFFRNTTPTPVAPVNTTTAHGIYGVGDVINLTVSFNEAVVVDTTGGTPTLQLKTDSSYSYASYSSGSGSSTLTFEYTVQNGDNTLDLDQSSSTALALNGGSIADAAGNAAILALAAPGETGSLGANAALVIFTNGPAITGVASSTVDGNYGIGDAINLNIGFSEAVFVDTSSGTPTLQLETGTTDRYATYSSGSGSSTLTFQYTVQEGDTSADLDQLSSSALALNDSTIKDAAGNNAILTLAAPGETGSLAANADLIIDATRPTGSLGSFATNPTFTQEFGDESFEGRTDCVEIPEFGYGPLPDLCYFDNLGRGNPFGIIDVGNNPSPAFADIDSDGDLDLFIGYTPGIRFRDKGGDDPQPRDSDDGKIRFFRNTGSANAPAYTQEGGDEPFGIADVNPAASPAFADIDGDGDLDLFIGDVDGNTLFFRNTGSASAPAYTQEGDANPFGILNPNDLDLGSASPTFADIDNDGDLDLLIGVAEETHFFRNTGSTSAPAYTQEGGRAPLGLGWSGAGVSPTFADIDNDSDFDLFITEIHISGDYAFGETIFFRNTAAIGATTPAYTRQEGRIPFGIHSVGAPNKPAFADIDDDGDLDLFIGYNQDVVTEFEDLKVVLGGTRPEIAFFRNTADTPLAPINTTTASGSYGIGDVINLNIGFSEAVFVDTTSGSPTLQLETGTTDRYATYSSGSGSPTLTFQYTVQEGDTSADLDQLSSSALALNDGTIKDAAGNNAILTLAAPGETGSLAANSDLVIDGNVPSLSVSIYNGGDGIINAREQVNSTIFGSTTGVEDGRNVSIAITSDAGGTPITTNARVTSNSYFVTGVDLSYLGDGSLSITADVDDFAGNSAPQAFITVTKNTSSPSFTTVVETIGNTALLKNSEGVHYAQNLSTGLISAITVNGKPVSTSSKYRRHGAENFDGANHMASTRLSDGLLYKWTLNDNWERTANTRYALGSSGYYQTEEDFDQDFDGDGTVGNPIEKTIRRGTNGADQFTFDQFEPFTKNTADRIIGFKPSQGDTIGVSAAACPSLLGADEITFVTARNAKEARRLSRQDINFVYFQDRGRLFFNGNGVQNGWGDRDEGGTFAFMKKKPELSVEDFTLLA